MHNDIIDPGCKLSAEAVVKPDGSLHLAAWFPYSSRSHWKKPKEPTQKLPGCVCDLGCLPNVINATRKSRDFERHYMAALNKKEIAPFILAIKVLHESILEAAFHKLRHHGRSWIGMQEKNVYLFLL